VQDEAEVVSQLIGAEAARLGLGRYQGTYLPSIPSTTRMQAGWTITAVLAALGVLGLAVSSAALAVIGLSFAVIFAYRLTRVSVISSAKRGQQLQLFELGLVCADREGHLHVLRWDNTSVLQKIVRHTRNGVYTHTTYAYTLTDPDGQRLVLRGGLTRPEEWGAAIQHAVTQAQLPGAVSSLQRGGTLNFGDISMNLESVSARGKTAAWSEVQEIRVKDGLVSLRTAGKWRALSTTPVSAIPNFFVFHALAEECRRSASPTD
jgi:hypothetical protein